MRASEILQGLAELLASVENGGNQQTTNQVELSPVSKYTSDTQEPTGVDQAGTFVPPLQAKIELLKKAVDVDSIYDQTGQGADNEDELARMRKMAGINPVVADEAASDEPLDI